MALDGMNLVQFIKCWNEIFQDQGTEWNVDLSSSWRGCVHVRH